MGIARINCLYFVYDDGCKSYMLTSLGINTASAGIQLVRSSSLVSGGAHGRERGAATGAGTQRRRTAAHCRSASSISVRNALRDGAMEGEGGDAVAAMQGVVYREQDWNLVNWDGCFY